MVMRRVSGVSVFIVAVVMCTMWLASVPAVADGSLQCMETYACPIVCDFGPECCPLIYDGHTLRLDCDGCVCEVGWETR